MIKTEIDGDLTVLTIEHGKVNAMDLELCQALIGALDDSRLNGSRAVVLTGNDRVFSAGVDLVRIVNEDEAYLSEFLPLLVRCLKKLFEFEKPVVAAINGHAIAGGCLLASACDYRVIIDKARIGLPELRVGVPLPSVCIEIMRFVATAGAFQAMVTMGQSYRGWSAIDVGLADEVVGKGESLDAAKKAAHNLLSNPDSVFKISKIQMRSHAHHLIRTSEEKFDAGVFALWKSDEIRGVIQRYVESRL